MQPPEDRDLLPRCPNVADQRLRKTLDGLFPASYLRLYHEPPSAVCSLLSVELGPQLGARASCEPSSRNQLLKLQQQLSSSLVEHGAQAGGLCPVRRAIYDQLFDELLRQVTVGCVERGLLLARARDELRATLASYQRAYQSALDFGLAKALANEAALDEARGELAELRRKQLASDAERQLERLDEQLELRNQLESSRQLQEHSRLELERKQQIIERQRAMLNALADQVMGAAPATGDT